MKLSGGVVVVGGGCCADTNRKFYFIGTRTQQTNRQCRAIYVGETQKVQKLRPYSRRWTGALPLDPT